MKYDPDLRHSLPPHTFWAHNPQGFIKVRRFGRNASVGTSQFDPVWGATGPYPWPTVAAPIRIKAGGNAADDAAGLGAQNVWVSYLDEAGALTTEQLATAGASASAATSKNAIRFIRAWVEDVGTMAGANTAAINFEQVGGNVIGIILAGAGQTQMAIHTVPAGYRALMHRLDISTDSNKIASVKVRRRQISLDLTAMKSSRIVSEFDLIVTIPRDYAVPDEFGPLEDVWVEAEMDTVAGAVSAEFDMILHEL